MESEHQGGQVNSDRKIAAKGVAWLNDSGMTPFCWLWPITWVKIYYNNFSTLPTGLPY